MNFFQKFFSIFFSQDSFFKSIKKEDFQITSFFFILGFIIQLFASLWGNFGLDFFLLYISIVLISFFVITFMLNIYSDKANLNKVFVVYNYSLIPIIILYVISSFNDYIYNYIIVEKPFILLLLGIYFLHIFSKGLNIVCGIKIGQTYSATALFGILAYIIYIGKLDVIIFYSVVLFLIFLKRKKFDAQGIVLLYKSKVGLKSMDQMAKKFPKILNVLAWVGIVLGFILMLLISYYLIDNAIKLVIVPDTMPGVAPILPGIPIPGSPIDLPLWYGLISIFITVVVHEFAHGVIARLHKIKVKSSGLFFMGPIIGAFIEPDDKGLDKSKTHHKLGVLGAGPFSNVLLGGLVLLIITFLIGPLFSNLLIEDGANIGVLENTPAFEANLQTGMVINRINDVDIIYYEDLYSFLNNTNPGDEINIHVSDEIFTVVLDNHPERNNTGYLGVNAIQNYNFDEKYELMLGSFILNLLIILRDFLVWLFIISLGVGVANLIPFGPADGGKMLYYILLKYYDEEKAKKISASVSTFFIVLLLFVLFFPLFQWIISQFV